MPGLGALAEPGDLPVPGQMGGSSPPERKCCRATTTEEDWERICAQVTDRWVQAHNQLVPLELLDVEVGVAGGQIQSLAAGHVREALHRFRQVQPTEPVDVTMWNAASAEPGLSPPVW